MRPVIIVTSKATSLRNVGADIAYVAQKKGYVPRLFKYPPPLVEIPENTYGLITVMSASPLLASQYMLLNRDVSKHIGVPNVFYATIEGKPKNIFIADWMFNGIKYVANSRYTYDKLTEAGFPVTGIVYHGVNFKNVELAKPTSSLLRKNIKKKVGDKVVIGIVSNSHPRKALEPFCQVIKQVLCKRKDVVFYIVTEAPLPVSEGVILERAFGKRTHTEVLALIGAFDFLVIPSYTEGFGLPLIEANAFGVPVIHTLYPPLSEITSEANFHVPYADVVEEDYGDGILYELRIWKLNDFVDAIIDAVECYLNRKSEYEDRKAKAIENAKRFDIETLYPKLLEYLGEGLGY